MDRVIDIKTIQSYELGVMKYIDSFCRENNIKYYLAYGTALGAVRHKGFIPWDDDMDIIMPRPDWEKFLDLHIKNPHSRYKLACLEIDKTYTSPLVKMYDSKTKVIESTHRDKHEIGLWVDIFILDGVPNEEKAYKKFVKKQDNLSKCWNNIAYDIKPVKIGKAKSLRLLRFIKGHILNALKNLIYKLIGTRRIANRLCENAKKYKYENSSIVGVTGWHHAVDKWSEYITTKEIIGEGIEFEFEGKKFIVPTKYDEYLTQTYGDYMTPPPIEQQKNGHSMAIDL